MRNQHPQPRGSSGSPGTGSGSPQCGQVFALGETALLQTLHGFISGFSSSGIATQYDANTSSRSSAPDTTPGGTRPQTGGMLKLVNWLSLGAAHLKNLAMIEEKNQKSKPPMKKPAPPEPLSPSRRESGLGAFSRHPEDSTESTLMEYSYSPL